MSVHQALDALEQQFTEFVDNRIQALERELEFLQNLQNPSREGLDDAAGYLQELDTAMVLQQTTDLLRSED